MLFTIFYAIETEYKVLFRGLESQEASQIIDWLKQEQVPYQLQGESIVLVPAHLVYDVRLRLAGKGLPKSKNTGFELFDQNPLHTTEFLQQLNYTRALQGELSRTIGYLEGVEKATVHIARPKPSLFQRKQESTTASIVLHIKRGHELSKKSIYGIAYLVSNSVEGLRLEDVSILDQNGHLLFQKESQSNSPSDEHALEIQKNREEYLKNKAQSLLEEIVGKNKAIVRIHLEMDLTETKELKETYNPDSQTVQKETVRTHKSRENPQEGITGVKENLKKTTTNQKQREEFEETKETEYVIDKNVKEVQNKTAICKRLSLALVLDQSLSDRAEAIGRLIQETVGYQNKRGDTFQVTTIPFSQEEQPQPQTLSFIDTHHTIIVFSIKAFLAAFGMLLLTIILLKIFRKPIEKAENTNKKDVIEGIQEKSPVEISDLSLQNTVQQVRKISQENTQDAAALLHQWFEEKS